MIFTQPRGGPQAACLAEPRAARLGASALGGSTPQCNWGGSSTNPLAQRTAPKTRTGAIALPIPKDQFGRDAAARDALTRAMRAETIMLLMSPCPNARCLHHRACKKGYIDEQVLKRGVLGCERDLVPLPAPECLTRTSDGSAETCWRRSAKRTRWRARRTVQRASASWRERLNPQLNSDPRSSRRRVRREVSDIEHRPRQLGLRQDRLRLRHHVRGRMLIAGNVIVEQRLHLGHALADSQFALPSVFAFTLYSSG